jgi:MEMO1 family protein
MIGSSTLRDVRPSPIAGTWYPGIRGRLETTVDGLMSGAGVPHVPGDVIGLVAPHAGYAFSGAIAAQAYAQVRGSTRQTVVLLGPDHRGSCGAYGIASYRQYVTPLGPVDVDLALVQKLGKLVTPDMIEQDEEHSLEIQLPFLQRALGSFTLLPIMLGLPLTLESGGLSACRTLSSALTEILSDRPDVLLVASTDLSHLYDYDEVVRNDRVFADVLGSFDAQRMARALLSGECQACGGAAVVTVMTVARARGAREATVLAYANSGDVTGNRTTGNYTVGYAAAAFTTPAGS